MKKEKNTKEKDTLKIIDYVYIALGAALISVCAWIAIPLTVSITLQTMGVCIVSGFLGAKRGTLSVLVYILLGAVGLPVFTGFKNGISAITGPTGGYIIGFVFTALIVGLACDKLGRKIWTNALFMLLGIAVCYAFGTVWFSIMYKVSLAAALSSCVVPFIIPDLVKIILASLIVNRLKNIVKK